MRSSSRSSTRYGNFDIISTISRIFQSLSSMPPHLRRVAYSTSFPCLLDANFCLRSDVMTNSRLQARDAHDTFFMSQPETSDTFPEEYLEKVKDVHEKGGFGSIGYRYGYSSSY